MSALLLASLQVLLVVPLEGPPVRFGVPLPAAAVARGLSLQGAGVLQWRRLPIGGPAPDPVWVEVAIVGGRGKVSLVAGGAPACADGRGPAFVREDGQQDILHGRQQHTTWRWSDGTIDERVRTVFTAVTQVGAGVYSAGEARTVESAGLGERAAVVCRLSRHLDDGRGLLPPVGRVGRDVRKELVAALPFLRELPGERGAGDFGRSGGVVTNLEFDTTLALLRCAVALGDTAALGQARRCARHLLDRDFDPSTGLPFPHGPDHRTGVPEPGHVWLRGLLWVGLLTADDGHLAAARTMGRALAACPPRGDSRQERARDHAWPLGELESLLAVDDDRVLGLAATRLALAIGARYDPTIRTFRFGEGEVENGVYLERGWITGGIVLPALQAHLRRRPDAWLAERVRAAQQALLDQIGTARPGLPTHWRCAGGRTFAEHRCTSDPAAVMLLDGLAPADVRRLLQREVFRDSTAKVLLPDDPDLPTTFTMVARCTWVWR